MLGGIEKVECNWVCLQGRRDKIAVGVGLSNVRAAGLHNEAMVFQGASKGSL